MARRPRGRSPRTDTAAVYPQVPVLWLAFASACYFHQQTTHGVTPLFVAGPDLDGEDLKRPAHWTRNSAPPGLPSLYVEFLDGIERYFSNPMRREIAPPRTRPLPPPYENGFTNLIYVTEAFRTVAGAQVPTRFRCLQFRMSNEARTSNDLAMAAEFVGHVTNVSPTVALKSFLPELPKTPVRVSDERFVRDTPWVNHFEYSISSQWPTREEAKRKPEYDAQFRLQQQLAETFQPRRRQAKEPPLRKPVEDR